MKRLLYIFISCIVFTAIACTGRHDRYAQMLEEAEWMNRNDSLFTSDSIGLALVQHYDHWWHSSNHRMRAYYMLGCAYRDMGEAPAAIHYYNIATERADTTRANCDYATLFRIYGQMAELYEQQGLPNEILTANQAFSHYAWLAHDTLNYILGIERQVDSYYETDDTTMIFRITEQARQLYLRYGYKEQAAQVYPTAIYICLTNGNFPRAKKYMEIFEDESGIFDEQGNIIQGREHYYYSKGLYHIGTGKIDSAEYYFRRLQQYGHFYESCKGLLAVYREKRNSDSIVKYSNLCEKALSEWMGNQQADAIIMSSKLYRYERNQEIAEREAKDAEISHYAILLLFSLLIIIVGIARLMYYHVKQKRLREEITYRALVEEHMKIQILCQQQKEQISTYQQDVLEKEEELKNEDVIKLLKNIVCNVGSWNVPAKKDWDKLIRTYKKYMPHMYARMQVAHLSQREQYICILSHLDFTPSEQVILLNTSKQIVSNTRLSAKRKLFEEESSLTLVQSLKKCAYFQI